MSKAISPFEVEGYTVKENVLEDDGFHVHLIPPEPDACPICGVIGEVVRNGKNDIRIADLPVHDKPVTAWVRRQKYRCKACGSVFRPDLPGIVDGYNMTVRLYNHIAAESFRQPFKTLAEHLGINPATVRFIFLESLAVRNTAYHPETPNVLGIDELHMGQSYVGVVTNIEENTLIEVLKDRNKDTVVDFLQSLDSPNKVEVVCMDMWNPYRDAVHTTLPNASVIVDKFHVVRMANVSLDTIRKKLRSQLSQKARRVLKNDRKLLLKRESELSPQDILKVSGWLRNFPVLDSAYRTKESFYAIWDEARDCQTARDMLCAWRANIPEDQTEIWYPLVRATKNWEREILNYFRYGSQYTNATTESLNNIIRAENRKGRGYNYEVLRGKLLFGRRHKVQEKRKGSPFAQRSFEHWLADLAARGHGRPQAEPRYIDYGADLLSTE